MMLAAEWGQELCRIRTVRSWGSTAVILYERAIVHAPRGIAIPVAGASIEVRKGGPTGDTIAATAGFGLIGAVVSRVRLYMTVTGGGFAFNAYTPGRDARHVQSFVARAREQIQNTSRITSPPLPPSASTTGVAAQIAELAQLRASGAVTEEEFAAKKAELLSRI